MTTKKYYMLNFTEYKNLLESFNIIHNETEKRRFDVMTRRLLESAVNKDYRMSSKKKDVIHIWNRYNKYMADWNRFSRRLNHRTREGGPCGDYSHLAYNGATDNF